MQVGPLRRQHQLPGLAPLDRPPRTDRLGQRAIRIQTSEPRGLERLLHLVQSLHCHHRGGRVQAAVVVQIRVVTAGVTDQRGLDVLLLRRHRRHEGVPGAVRIHRLEHVFDPTRSGRQFSDQTALSTTKFR